MTPRSGTPFILRSGASRAEVSGTGAALRALVLDDVEVLDGFDLDHIAPGGAGQVLAPWPNRLEDGTYTFDGIAGTVPINEGDRRNAIHGLVRWHEWSAVASTADAVTLGTVLVPNPAYPWRLRLEITYRLDRDSLTVGFAAHNEDDRSAPFGIGFHPYFLAEGGVVDAASVSVPAGEHLRLDDRALPVGREPVAQTPYAAIVSDEGLPLAGVVLDDCFTTIVRSADGSTVAKFRPGPGRRPVTLTLGRAFTHLMCFTGDTLQPPRRRRAMAFEPMTCAPNGLHTGEGIAAIAPGATFADEFIVAFG